MEIIYKNISDIIPYENNPRKNDNAVNEVAKSIEEYGMNSPIVIDEKNIIINGHTRYKALMKMNIEEVPVIEVKNLTEAQKKAYRIADNRLNELSSWDFDLLKKEIEEINFLDDKGNIKGIDDDYIQSIFTNDEQNDVEKESTYTKKILRPSYEVTGLEVSVNDLVDDEKTNNLIKEIENTDIDEKIKRFLILSSYRHLNFNYKNIAEYYSKADKKIQELFEHSCLVILDFDDAIENGYVELNKRIEEIVSNEE